MCAWEGTDAPADEDVDDESFDDNLDEEERDDVEDVDAERDFKQRRIK